MYMSEYLLYVLLICVSKKRKESLNQMAAAAVPLPEDTAGNSENSSLKLSREINCCKRAKLLQSLLKAAFHERYDVVLYNLELQLMQFLH